MFKNKQSSPSSLITPDEKAVIMERKKEELLVEISHLGKKKEEAERQYEAYINDHSEVTDLSNQLQVLRKEVTDLDKKKKDVLKSIKEDEKKAQVKADAILNIAREESNELREKASSLLANTIGNVNKKHKEIEEEVDDLTKRKVVLEQSIDSLTSHISEQKDTLSNLSQEEDTLKKSIEVLGLEKDELEEISAEVVDATHELDQLAQDISFHESEIEKKEKLVKKINIDLEGLQGEKNALKKEVEAVKDNRDKVVAEAKKEMDAARSELDTKIGFISDRTSWLNEKEEKIKNIVKEVEKELGRKLPIRF